jgi:hypothetical protein
MRKRLGSKLAMATALSLLVFAGGLGPAAAKCSQSTYQCPDVTNKQNRTCTTTVCTDDKGAVLSVSTTVEMEGGKAQPKAAPQKAPAGGVKQQ